MSPRSTFPRLLLACVAACAAIAALAAASSSGSRPPSAKSPSAQAAARYLTGIGDQNAEMFLDPNWQQLHTRIARYIAPYDAAASTPDLNAAKLWIARAQAAHQRVLVAFYHSERSPTRLPSVRSYERDVKRFVRL